MPKVSPIQTNFNGGEWSPLMLGRTDLDQYKSSLKYSLNGIPLVQGAWTRRPGTYFAAEVKTSAKKTRLVRFEFSTTQAYILEFGDLYVRFYRDHGRIEDPPGTPIEVVTPYTEAQLFELKFTQSADVLYIAHTSHARRKLSRTSHIAWTLTAIADKDGPYLPANVTATTLTPSGTSGSITVTASATTGINNNTGFQTTDVGRVIRFKHSTTWSWGTITARASTTSVTVLMDGTTTASATSSWRLGLWSGTTGYPAAVTFFDDRLWWGGGTSSPQRIDGSVVGDYEHHRPTALDGTLADDDAVAYTLNSSDVQVIRWLADDEKALLVGTVKAEWVVRASSQNEALTPTNINAKPSTRRGSANIQPVQAGNATLFVQRAGRKLREFAYVYESDGFRSPDMTALSEHITRGGIVDMAYQQEPQSIVWCARGDGALIGFTYERDQKVLGWHRHELGGPSSAGGAAAIVESVACVPAPSGDRDELWMVVKRYIDGATKRYVEYMGKAHELGDDQADAFYVDCGLTYDGAAADTISGLDHLEGETVKVLADGAAHPDRVVASGEITLNAEASVVQIGYGYNSDGQLQRPEAGAADGTAQGKTQRTHRVVVRLHESLGLKVGPTFDRLDELIFRRSSDDTGAAVPLFSGDKADFAYDGDYTNANHFCWRFDQPFPGTILSVMPQLHTQDR